MSVSIPEIHPWEILSENRRHLFWQRNSPVLTEYKIKQLHMQLSIYMLIQDNSSCWSVRIKTCECICKKSHSRVKYFWWYLSFFIWKDFFSYLRRNLRFTEHNLPSWNIFLYFSISNFYPQKAILRPPCLLNLLPWNS